MKDGTIDSQATARGALHTYYDLWQESSCSREGQNDGTRPMEIAKMSRRDAVKCMQLTIIELSSRPIISAATISDVPSTLLSS